VWAKIQAKKIFAHIRDVLPRRLFGSTPNRSAIEMAILERGKLEHSLMNGTSISGCSLDISKAYNAIPRGFLRLAAARLGLTPMWTPYEHFLSGNKRHFVTKGYWGGAILSKVGVPEGCPLAVLQMIILTWAVMNCAGNLLPSDASFSTYVDDWTIKHTDPSVTMQGLQCTHSYLQALGMTLSKGKTKLFATSKQGRQALDTEAAISGLRVTCIRHFKDLGVDFQTTYRTTAKTRTHRLQGAVPRMKKIQYLPWARERKISVLRRAVRPSCSMGAKSSQQVTAISRRSGPDSTRRFGEKSNIWVASSHLCYLPRSSTSPSSMCFQQDIGRSDH
jgi:hypothetical protein